MKIRFRQTLSFPPSALRAPSPARGEGQASAIHSVRAGLKPVPTPKLPLSISDGEGESVRRTQIYDKTFMYAEPYGFGWGGAARAELHEFAMLNCAQTVACSRLRIVISIQRLQGRDGVEKAAPIRGLVGNIIAHTVKARDRTVI